MNQFYVHVRLFEATAEQTKKFEELMLNFLYQKTVKESDDSCCRLIPEGYILRSTMNCQQILDQTFSIANSAGVDANIFVCKFEQSACLLPSASLVGNDFVHYDLTPKPIKLDS
ncbi:hypothetical protein PSI59_004027 [Escherichia coli]|uniref:YmfI family phage protein n=1 Tax=Escherichia coli TaxID=562 RepID=UPI00092D6E21|nr:protein YmfI [Escherichia coli]EEZ9729610.1 hypothetical protein [Escherichia coli O2]EKF4584743.1 hypothetical protein [Escherichia coli O26]EEQ2114619.1 hypothetical protein [Escherichia coli]EEQ3584196.1 hypothetical protein [Escherichia coli]EEQ3661719.1 hypothetical protein [Escherichia coli]